jgi:hypothetical protein
MDPELQAYLDAMQEVILTQIRTERDALMERINANHERVLTELVVLRDDITVTFGANETLRKTHDNTREELRALHAIVTTQTRQIRRLEEQVRDLRGLGEH